MAPPRFPARPAVGAARQSQSFFIIFFRYHEYGKWARDDHYIIWLFYYLLLINFNLAAYSAMMPSSSQPPFVCAYQSPNSRSTSSTVGSWWCRLGASYVYRLLRMTSQPFPQSRMQVTLPLSITSPMRMYSPSASTGSLTHPFSAIVSESRSSIYPIACLYAMSMRSAICSRSPRYSFSQRPFAHSVFTATSLSSSVMLITLPPCHSPHVDAENRKHGDARPFTHCLTLLSLAAMAESVRVGVARIIRSVLPSSADRFVEHHAVRVALLEVLAIPASHYGTSQCNLDSLFCCYDVTWMTV